jgi:hypothetical protein
MSLVNGLLLIFNFGPLAHDSDQITQLQKENQALKFYLSNLESPQNQSSSHPKSRTSSEGWKVLANWRSLKTVMSENDVRATLKEPTRIDGGRVALWRYPKRGYITFYDGQLYK